MNCVSARVRCYLSKGPLKRDFLDIYLTTIFGVRKFKNTSAMSIILFLEMLKIESIFRKCEKKWDIIFCFWDICLWKFCKKLPLLRREYLSSAVNGLRKCPKISHITQRDSFDLDYLHRDQKYGKGAVVQISTVFRPVYHVTFKRVLRNGII